MCVFYFCFFIWAWPCIFHWQRTLVFNCSEVEGRLFVLGVIPRGDIRWGDRQRRVIRPEGNYRRLITYATLSTEDDRGGGAGGEKGREKKEGRKGRERVWWGERKNKEEGLEERERQRKQRHTDTRNPQRTHEKGRDKITEMDRGKETLNDTTKGNELLSKHTEHPRSAWTLDMLCGYWLSWIKNTVEKFRTLIRVAMLSICTWTVSTVEMILTERTLSTSLWPKWNEFPQYLFLLIQIFRCDCATWIHDNSAPIRACNSWVSSILIYFSKYLCRIMR